MDEIMASGRGTTYSPPLKIFRTSAGAPGGGSYVDYVLGATDNHYDQATRGTSFFDGWPMRNDPGTPTGTVSNAQVGGITTVAATPLPGHTVQCQGGGSGSTWGYKIVGVSGGKTVYTSGEVTVSCSSALNREHFNQVTQRKTPGYGEIQLWLTSNPGDGRGTGMIARFSPLQNVHPECTSVNAAQGCDGGLRTWYMQDKGQAVITAGLPRPTNADGRVTAAGGVQPASTGGLMTWFQTATHAALNLASVANATCSPETTETITGAALGDSCSVAAATALEAGGFFRCAITAANTVKWAFCNLSGSAIDRASDTYTIRVIR